MVRESNKLHSLFPFRREGESIFAIQYTYGENKKTYKFVLATDSAFWGKYMCTQCTGCEVILEDSTCHLYVDIDVNLTEAPGVTARDCWNKVEPVIRYLFSIQYPDVELRYITMDSNNERKSSMHVIIKLKGHVFKNNAHCGAFMNLVEAYIERDSSELKEPFKYFDMGVYTKNRLFRMMGCTKVGEKRPLCGGELTFESWMDSRVCAQASNIIEMNMSAKYASGHARVATNAPPCVYQIADAIPHDIVRIVAMPWCFKYACDTNSRDCVFQNRVHKTNVNYVVIDLLDHSYTVRCRSRHCKGKKTTKMMMDEHMVELANEYLNQTITVL
jgi:hypothetical protein